MRTPLSKLSKRCPLFSEEPEDLKKSLGAQKINQEWFEDKLDLAGNLPPTRELITKYTQGDYGMDWSCLDSSEEDCPSMQELELRHSVVKAAKGNIYT